MKKRICSLVAAAMLTTAVLAGCANQGGGTITVVSREDGSGTRGAFVELFGIEQENDAGEKVDNTTEKAETTNSTSVMMTTIAGNKNAIGYLSLGVLDDTVKALKIDGAEATAENVKNGQYKVSRPFNIATKADVSDLAKDFIAFIMSKEGQDIIEEEGYIRVQDGDSYTATGLTGTLKISGSSSVTPVMEVLKEAYLSLNPDVSIELQQSDSTTGMNDVIQGTSDIGMASRELKDSETSEGLSPTVIAMDGIAVIVNKENTIDELSSDQVRDIYTGNITQWSELEK